MNTPNEDAMEIESDLVWVADCIGEKLQMLVDGYPDKYLLYDDGRRYPRTIRSFLLDFQEYSGKLRRRVRYNNTENKLAGRPQRSTKEISMYGIPQQDPDNRYIYEEAESDFLGYADLIGEELEQIANGTPEDTVLYHTALDGSSVAPVTIRDSINDFIKHKNEEAKRIVALTKELSR